MIQPFLYGLSDLADHAGRDRPVAVWNGYANPAFLPPGMAAPFADGYKAGPAEFFDELSGRFICDHPVSLDS